MEIVLKAIGTVLLLLLFWKLNKLIHAMLDYLFDFAMFKDLDKEGE